MSLCIDFIYIDSTNYVKYKVLVFYQQKKIFRKIELKHWSILKHGTEVKDIHFLHSDTNLQMILGDTRFQDTKIPSVLSLMEKYSSIEL